ncbi:hypothetical protein DXG03_004587 [Asterophora parasitica]|uniref:Queuosine 5'-phosphate N-glycosylase/hydrolase n=1 Tax=Asterophora parasitica TaxID=117018 RepID=A0A9P7KBP4_9AGAR|nr:hypothetical protein DXG03_004587 [Asterophora parasitica]
MASNDSEGFLDEKAALDIQDAEELTNPVILTSEYAYKVTDVVHINDGGVKMAAQHIRQKLAKESYTPRTWRTHPLHIVPSDPYVATDPNNKTVLNWIFLISSLNFSFWSEKEGTPERYGVEWRKSWNSEDTNVWTGYWSLVAALNRDSLLEQVFRPAKQSTETVPLFRQRIAIMREVGTILCKNFGGSFQGFLEEFQRRHNNEGTALQLVNAVTETFPSYRDEVIYNGKKVYLWKRAQILVAETWAAFFPATSTSTHPIFPGSRGPQIQQLTMFADYRVPQILHHLRILTYPPSLIKLLQSGTPLEPGSKEEVSLRAASIIAVERVREEILRLFGENGNDESANVSSVLIDFYLWDLAKKVESGEEKIEGIATAEMVPIHRTRSIWY